MSKRIFEDAFNLLCGDKLGSGVHRDVFACRLRPDLVVKVEQAGEWRSFANVEEMRFWSENMYCPTVAAWLAPCEYLSPDGRILLQRRVRIAVDGDALPERVPAFLTDLKPSNYGWMDGRFVCVDYAGRINDVSMRMKKAAWR